MTLTPDYYHDSRPFNLLRTSSDARYVAAIDSLLPLLNLKDSSKTRQHLLLVLVNIVQVAAYRPGYFLYYSRNNNYWTALGKREARRFNPFRISRKLVEVIDALVEAGYLKHVGGYNARRKADKRWAVQSRIGLTPKLQAFIKVHGLTRASTHYAPTYPVIRLRGEGGEMIHDISDRRMPKVVAQSEAIIRRYNAFMAEQELLLEVTDHGAFLDDVAVYRVFNRQDWKSGGRLAGAWWMNCDRAHRKAIYINDEATVELDYTAQHINLLYALRGLVLPKTDPYSINGFKRDAVKAVCLRLINAATVEQAWQACRSEALKDLKAKRNSILANEIDACLSSLEGFEDGIVQAIRSKHLPIADDFCSDKGIRLMNLDSTICLSVLNILTQQGIPCLSVHDSFLVQKSHEATLRNAMAEAYKGVGLGDYVPTIK